MDSHQLVFDVVETLGHEIRGLVFGDRVRMVARHLGVEFLERRFAGQRVLELADRRQQPRAVRLQLAVLPAQPELDGEPITLQRNAHRFIH